ncbi:MAG TPA: hypothetical protein VFJ52_12620 [Terriglobia bacterium]|nr:hypothetical protein [Terriglobia bacterium]
MRSCSLISATLFLAAAPLAAQLPNHSQPQNLESRQASPVPPAGNSTCPVAVRVEHAADGSLVGVDGRSLKHPAGAGQGLVMSISAPDGRQIVKAVITVHGFEAKGRTMGTLVARGRPDAFRTLRIRLSPVSENASAASIWISGMSAIDSIDLVSVTYANGLSQRLAHGAACHIDADHSMLIGKH